MIAACLPSVRPLFKAFGVFTRTHIASSKPMRMNSSSDSQSSLKNSSSPQQPDYSVELKRGNQNHQAIQVQYDVELQREQNMPGGLSQPSYNFEVR